MVDPPDTDDPRGPSLLYREDGVFHPDAVEEVDAQTERFRKRLESTAVRLSDQQQADSVSRTHVNRAYDTLIPPSQTALRRRRLTNIALGASASAIVSVLLALFNQEGSADPEQLLFLFALICVLAYASYKVAEE